MHRQSSGTVTICCAPGETTTKNRWKMVDYKPPRDIYSTRGTITLVSYQIDRDWIKVIRENRRPWKEY